jgi:hypothetical protein
MSTTLKSKRAQLPYDALRYSSYDYVEIDPDRVSAEYFCQHFPDIAAIIHDWNREVHRFRVAVDQLDGEADRPVEGTSVKVTGVLTSVAKGAYFPLNELVWFGRPVWTVDQRSASVELCFRYSKTNQDITVCRIPFGSDPLVFARRVQEMMSTISRLPETKELMASARRERLQKELSKELDRVRLNYALGGRCEGCRPRKPAAKPA